jgi:hypothetical protein
MTTKSNSRPQTKQQSSRRSKKSIAGSADQSESKQLTGSSNETVSKSEPIGQSTSGTAFRRLPKRLIGSFGEKARFLLWGLPTSIAGSTTEELLEKLQRTIQRDECSTAVAASVAESLASAQGSTTSDPGLHLAIAAAYALPQLGASATAEVCTQISESLRSLATAEDVDVEANPTAWLLSAVELPLVLGLVEHPLDEHRLAELFSRFSSFVEQNLEEEGWLPQPLLSELSVMHASLLRCQLILEYLEQRYEERIAHRLEWMTRNVLRLLDHNQQQMLGDGVVQDLSGIARASRRLTTDEEDARLLKAVESDEFPGAKRLPDSSGHCEELLTGVLRGNWLPRSSKLAVQSVEGRQVVQISARDVLVKGSWTPEIVLNGDTLKIDPASVEVNCWNTDIESVYLEFEVKMDGGVTWQRQYALDKREHVLFVGDVFFGNEPGRWEYRCQIPLAAGVSVEDAHESRELRLLGPKSTALLLPLSMGEWKADRTDDSFVSGEQGIEAQQTRRGLGCMFAIAFDLDPKRAKRASTWRNLTVSENLKPVARDQALAFRFQFAEQQWLIYRSLTPITNRSYLGQNVYSEFAFDRFLEDGTAESLISVE